MIIRDVQFKAMQQAVDQRYADGLIRTINDDYSRRQDVLADPYLRESVIRLMTRARRYGLSSDRDLRTFVCLSLFICDRFDEFPPLAGILNDNTTDPSDRVEYLLSEMDADDWIAAQQWVADLKLREEHNDPR